MPISETRAAAIKAAAHKYNADQERQIALNRGMPAKAAETLAAAVTAPLVGFSDGYHVHFTGEDADCVGATSVDLRDWNAVLEKLTEAGYTVSLTQIDADMEDGTDEE